jgi:hypothetical protein
VKPLITGTDFVFLPIISFVQAEQFYGGVLEFQGETMDSGVCYQAYFQDPDGNALILHHRYAPPGEKPPA